MRHPQIPQLVTLLLITSNGFAQSVWIGAKGRVPLAGGFSAGPGDRVTYSPILRRYTVGPSIDIGLPWGLRLEADALYTRMGWDSSGRQTALFEAFQSMTRMGAWEFTILPKRVFRKDSGLRPYVGVGPTFRRFFTTRQMYQFTDPSRAISKQMVEQLRRKNIAGIAFTAGFEKGKTVRVAPEFRYTRWLMNNIYDGFSDIRTQANQAQFLVTFSFGVF